MSKEEKPKKPKCYNCKFSTPQFKVGNLSHVHCGDEKQYPSEGFENGETSAWDTLRVFSDTCEKHEFTPQPPIY